MRQTLTHLNLHSKLFAFLVLAVVFLPGMMSAQVQVNVTGTNVTCFGLCNGTATALGTGGWAPYTYHWSNGQTTATITGLCPGNYSVTVTDIDLGSAIGSITISQPNQLGINVQGQSQICGNVPDGWAAAVPFGGTPPYTYLWNTGATTPQINNLAAGVYTATVTDANGCTAAGSFTVGFWNEGIWLMTSHTDVTCFGFSNGTAHVSVMSGTPPYTYDWSNDGAENPDNDGADVVGLAPGNYSVTVTDANGCSNFTNVTIGEPAQLICMATSTPANCGLAGSAAADRADRRTPHGHPPWIGHPDRPAGLRAPPGTSRARPERLGNHPMTDSAARFCSWRPPFVPAVRHAIDTPSD